MSPRVIEARRKIRRAAKGTSSSWPWVYGFCPGCGVEFTRHGAGSYCSKKCGDAARRKRRNEFKSEVKRRARIAIFVRDGWVCQICQGGVERFAEPNSDWEATVDHVVPRSRGGSDDESNLRLAHRWCNSVRGDLTYYTDADLSA